MSHIATQLLQLSLTPGCLDPQRPFPRQPCCRTLIWQVGNSWRDSAGAAACAEPQVQRGRRGCGTAGGHRAAGTGLTRNQQSVCF